MKYLHTMVRINNIKESLDFYCAKLGLRELRRVENDNGRFTLIFLAAEGDKSSCLELTYNWDSEEYAEGRNFGHVAYQVADLEAGRQSFPVALAPVKPPNRGFVTAFLD